MNHPSYFFARNRRQLTIFVFGLLSMICNPVTGGVVSPMLTDVVYSSQSSSRKGGWRGVQEDSRYIPLVIKLSSPDVNVPDGVVELYRRGPFVLAYVPLDRLSEIAALGEVSRLEGGQVCVPVLDRARLFTGFPEIAASAGLPEVYTGKGVVTGFADTGFDPNNPAFKNPLTGKSRVMLLTDYGMSPDEMVRLDTPDEIGEWVTDDPEQWHATHVAGIMSGGYKGNPYWGIATESEIVATTSVLYDALLLAGMEDVVGYARSVGKPAVINMSVSASLGPHDGTSLFCQYLELLSKEAVICISAGNDGLRAGIWDCVFPEDCATATAVQDVPTWSPAKTEGYIDVWGGDASTFGFAVIVYDRETKRAVLREEFPSVSSENPDSRYTIASSPEKLEEAGADGNTGNVSVEFAGLLDGAVTLTTEVNPENGRFNGLVYLKVENLPLGDGKLSERYLVGLEVTGRKGQKMTGYSSDALRFRSVPGYPEFAYFGSDGVVNDFVTGKGVIGVGAMCSRNSWPQLNGEDGRGDYEVGSVAQFSSLSTKAVNGPLPDIVAPGAWLVSSVSTPYMESHPDQIPSSSLVENIDGVDYYWKSASGTSMSSPYVAGICALWLQADPTVSPEEIKRTILSTATAPTVDSWNQRWGRGVLNSYEGLRSILAGAGVESVRPDGTAAQLPPLPSPLTGESLMEYAREHSCRIHTMQGIRVDSTPLQHGVYILHTGDAAVKVVL